MKKLILCIIVAYVQYSTVAYSLEVRVVPVNRDKMTGHWNGLFGHDIALGWSDFRQKCSDEKEIASSIADMLQRQTHSAYTISAQQIENTKSSLRLSNGDILYCIPVDYISAPTLHKKMEESKQRDLTKDRFVWIPMDEVLRRRTVVKVARGNTSLFVFDIATRNNIKEHWYTKMLPELNAADPKKPYQRRQSDAVKKYLEVKKNNSEPKTVKSRMVASKKLPESSKHSKIAMVKSNQFQSIKQQSTPRSEKNHKRS